jgi:hypothetical protein
MLTRILMVGVAAAALGACVTETRTVMLSDDACSSYGFAVSSPEYRKCKSREADARKSGRVSAGYSQAQLSTDARSACQSYGIAPYTDAYERCVRNEIAQRAPG